MERVLHITTLILSLGRAHDRIVDFGDGLQNHSTELPLALRIFATDEPKDFYSEASGFFGQFGVCERLAQEAEHLPSPHFVAIVECQGHMQHLLDDEFALHGIPLRVIFLVIFISKSGQLNALDQFLQLSLKQEAEFRHFGEFVLDHAIEHAGAVVAVFFARSAAVIVERPCHEREFR